MPNLTSSKRTKNPTAKETEEEGEHTHHKALSPGLRVIGVEGLLKAVAGTRGHFVHTYKEKPKGTAEDRVHTLGSSSSDTRAERQKHEANLRETPGSGHSSPPVGGMRSSRASNASSPFLFSLKWASGS